MNRKAAAPVILTASLVVLMSGCAGAAAQGGLVRDDLRPAANAAELGLARGHVIVTDDLSPTRLTEESVAQVVRPDAARAWSAEARREFHAQQPAQSATVQQPFSPEVIRELKGSTPSVTVEQQPFSPEVIRELKGSTPSVTVDDDQSPLGGSR